MNNDLNGLQTENKSLNVLLRENELKMEQKDSVINNQSIIISQTDQINSLLKADNLSLSDALINSERKAKFFKGALFGSLGFIPVAIVVGFFMSRTIEI